MLEWGTDYFKQKGLPDPRHSIEWLLAEILQVKRLDLYLKFDRPLSEQELDELRPLVKRRAGHEPLQYIIGFTDFMKARISVTPDVLIPRIETEQLVEIILDDHPEGTGRTVVDIGTGSGCIPIALKMERPDWKIEAFDISEAALKIARKNAEENGAEISFCKGDILSENGPHPEGPFDVIVSNPPYVLPEEKELLEPQVVSHEPELALFCDDPGAMYGSIIRFAEKRLARDGALYLEIHEKYSEQIRGLFDPGKWQCEVRDDYEKRARFIIASPLS